MFGSYVFSSATTRCLRYYSGTLLLLIAILAVAGFVVAWWGGFGAEGYAILQDYFGFGRVPMRVTQSVLLFLTVLMIMLCPPWSF